jgi:hypothetical protein
VNAVCAVPLVSKASMSIGVIASMSIGVVLVIHDRRLPPVAAGMVGGSEYDRGSSPVKESGDNDPEADGRVSHESRRGGVN